MSLPQRKTGWELYEGERSQSLAIQSLGLRSRPWVLELAADRLTFLSSLGDGVVTMTRSEVAERLEIRGGRFLAPALTVRGTRGGRRRRSFKLSRGQLGKLMDWLGPLDGEHLRAVLRKRMSWTLPIGALYVLGSWPLPAHPGGELEAIPLDPWGMLLGIGLLLLGLFSWLRPGRSLLLADALWFGALCVERVVAMGRGATLWWLVFLAFLVTAALGAVDQYERFRAHQAGDRELPA